MVFVASKEDPTGGGSEVEGVCDASSVGRFRVDLARVRLDIGSNEMTRGFSGGTGAMSTDSVR